MSWARIDDAFADHRKVLGLSLEAVGLWTLTLAWAHRNTLSGTRQGIIPTAQAARFAGTRTRRLSTALVGAGLWDEVDGGWRIHDFGDYLESSLRTTAGTPPELSARRASAGRKGGKATQQRKQTGQANEQLASSKTRASAQANEQLADSPVVSTTGLRPSVPTPVPTTSGVLQAKPEATTAQTIITEYVDRCRKRPPDNVLGQLGRSVASLLAEGIDADDVRRGIVVWMTKGLHPSTLPSVVNEVMNAPPSGARRSTTDDAVAQAQALKAKFAGRELPA